MSFYLQFNTIFSVLANKSITASILWDRFGIGVEFNPRGFNDRTKLRAAVVEDVMPARHEFLSNRQGGVGMPMCRDVDEGDFRHDGSYPVV